MLHILSTVALVLIVMGLYFRHRRNAWHVRLMSAAFGIDVSLLLYIELTRQAVATAVSHMRPILGIHILASVVMLICYGALIVLGRSLRRGHEEHRTMHYRVAIVFCGFRGLNYVTSYFL